MHTGAPLMIERCGHIEIWTINLPEQRNPITGDDMVAAFLSATSRVNADRDVRCIILTGAGRAFSAGGNIKEIRSGEHYFGAPPFEAAEGYRNGVQKLAAAVFGCEVPLIAAVNGPAVGAGCDMTLMCDVRIASEHATFAESFVRLGLIPGDGGGWLLPRAIGPARAAEMALTGDAVPASTTAEWGLVSRVVTAEALLPTAVELAGRIAANPPPALRMAKRLLRQGQNAQFTEALELAAALQSLAHHTEDHRAAVAEPRATFTGR